jgi:hypothetical protein
MEAGGARGAALRSGGARRATRVPEGTRSVARGAGGIGNVALSIRWGRAQVHDLYRAQWGLHGNDRSSRDVLVVNINMMPWGKGIKAVNDDRAFGTVLLNIQRL